METILNFTIYNSVANIPENWNDLAINTVFLSKEYLTVLEKSAPNNMTTHFIGFYQNNNLVGVSIAQFLDLNKLGSFGERDKCIKSYIRNFIFKNFSSHVLFIGNNMLTGQNAYYFNESINEADAIKNLLKASEEIEIKYKNKGMPIHLTSFKDFDKPTISRLKQLGFNHHYQFDTQPNMAFNIPSSWKTNQDYIDALSKKYRDQYNRSHKKLIGVDKRKMNLEDIIKHEETIYELYLYVAKNAPFNTFFLAKNHFSVFKENLREKFLFYGYFINDTLIGFSTLIKNGDTMETYFLGYDEKFQKDKMLYLNMLYDMVGFSIKKGFKKIIFGRTALEIKSSVGAQPEEMFGFIKHRNSFLNKNLSRIFPYLEPKTVWQKRSPFK